ncbi:DUF4910 domain-containing protein [Lutimonas saemankumensis]|uniref:DUF4910 domain-containing protein n=1 Tax=Lutimonas saemankumensis TaxID=483016 RepID=UPI001CD22C7D|nr:DUF4910 domain-containing protein [Lutimonas saemankumensis]MCA0931054.1 DUF4910 domain-containing protein [Lutimonas saemankumensis]
MYNLIKELFPFCRSITGQGVRDTLSTISKYIPIEIVEVKSGTKVLDWIVPLEWNIREAWVKNSSGKKVIDFNKSNLHILNYSIPMQAEMSLEQLRDHIYTIPEKPDWIPYRTSYHDENWGFCMTHNDFLELEDDKYKINIDSTLKKGVLSYGEFFIEGNIPNEVLITTHICHPSMANDNLSGISVAVALAEYLSKRENYYSYRFLFIPGTIGSITWLSKNREKVGQIEHGLVLTLLGDSSNFNYKKSRKGNQMIDKIVENCLKNNYKSYGIIDFYPYGYDERQFCSPGFDLPVGRLSRACHGEFEEYHTSGDNLDFVNEKNLDESLHLIKKIVNTIEGNFYFNNLFPYGEPQLGKRGLFKKVGGESKSKSFEMALLWVLNQSDSTKCLLDISDISGISFEVVKKAAEELESAGLIEKI